MAVQIAGSLGVSELARGLRHPRFQMQSGAHLGATVIAIRVPLQSESSASL
jgi:hypothetical protein